MELGAFLTSAHVLVVAGKGGVGKSTVSAALGLLAARSGVDTMLIDVEGTMALPTLFGRSAPLGYDAVELASAAETGGVALRGRQITSDEALVEYLDDHGLRRVSKRLASTGTLDVVATAIPGIKDILVLGKIKSLELERRASLLIVDAPAAGHAVTFLASARGLVDAVEVGPINQQAASVAEMIADPARCEVLLVTLPEETPVNEAIETAFLLEDKAQVKLAPIVVNGVWPVLDLPTSVPPSLTGAEAASLEAAAAFRRRRQELQGAQVARLAEGLPLPQITLPLLMTTEIGSADLSLLASALAAGIEAL